MLIQWVCLGQVMFRESALEKATTMAIKFARLVDIYGITGIESLIAEHIKAIILVNPAPVNKQFDRQRTLDMNTHCLISYMSF